jgi:Protein of unknown function (DUF4019)
MCARLVVLVALLTAGVESSGAAQPAGAEDAAQKAAETWLALVDGGKYAESWAQASTMLKKQVTVEQWTDLTTKGRSSFGAFTSRSVNSRQYSTSLPGAPAGEYVILTFDGHFATRSAVETVVMVRDGDDGWRVAGAFIR